MNKLNSQRYFRLLTGLLCVLSSTSSRAQLIVIYDSGETQPLAPYLQSLQPEKPQNKPQNKPQKKPSPQPQLLGPADISNMLPMHSPGLTVGTLSPLDSNPPQLTLLAKGNPRPFFLIGTDERSRQWLLAHRSQLVSLGAVGMVVQANTEEELEGIAAIANGLPITLGSASDIAKALGIRHYPVLISARGVEQ